MPTLQNKKRLARQSRGGNRPFSSFSVEQVAVNRHVQIVGTMNLLTRTESVKPKILLTTGNAERTGRL